jgi:hypothetical protein
MQWQLRSPRLDFQAQHKVLSELSETCNRPAASMPISSMLPSLSASMHGTTTALANKVPGMHAGHDDGSQTRVQELLQMLKEEQQGQDAHEQDLEQHLAALRAHLAHPSSHPPPDKPGHSSVQQRAQDAPRQIEQRMAALHAARSHTGGRAAPEGDAAGSGAGAEPHEDRHDAAGRQAQEGQHKHAGRVRRVWHTLSHKVGRSSKGERDERGGGEEQSQLSSEQQQHAYIQGAIGVFPAMIACMHTSQSDLHALYTLTLIAVLAPSPRCHAHWTFTCWMDAELADANADVAAVLHRVHQERAASGTWQDLTGLPDDAPEDEQARALPP